MAGTTDVARRVIVSFLEKTGVTTHFPPRSPPQHVETKVREIIQSWDLGIPKDKYEKTLVAGLHFGYAPYQHTSYDLQIAFSLFSFCVIAFDDAALIDPNAMRDFVPRFCDGKPQLAPLLDQLVNTANDLRPFLHEYGANTMHPALLMFANEELWYTQHAKQSMIQPDAGAYIEYSRYKTGITESYAFGVWPKAICEGAEDYIQAIP